MVVGYLGLGLVLGLLAVFGLLQWWQIPAGSFADWVIGGATFGWLLGITTVPWNIYFDAREAVSEAGLSAEQGIAVDPAQVNYVQLVARRSRWVALALHGLSALALYGLAIAGISQIGYLGSAAALLLTLLRPAVRSYQYFARRIALIRQQFHYPRQDVLALSDRTAHCEDGLAQLQAQMDLANPAGWAAAQQRQWEALRSDLARALADLSELQATNQAEHARLAREAQQAIAQLSTDGLFLEHVREIIRFFKAA